MSKYVQLRWASPSAQARGEQPLTHMPMYFGVAMGFDEASGDVALAEECPCLKCATPVE